MKPWSITTTTRSPYRLRDQLRVLVDNFDGVPWTNKNQENFQIRLIQHRLYGHTDEGGFSSQFLSDLSNEHRKVFTDFSQNLTFEKAREIFDAKCYTDPAMRGRQSLNPFKKFGFVYLDDGILRATAFSTNFLADDYNLGDIFFRIFIKWQLPNPNVGNYSLDAGYDVKPFIATLHLIHTVNTKWEGLGNNPVGLSANEFILFVPTLVNFRNIDEQAQKIVDLRLLRQRSKSRDHEEIFLACQQKFASEFFEEKNPEKLKTSINNLRDYGDNAIRYFRLTNLIFIRGNGRYVDLEKRRSIEIQSLINFDTAQSDPFESKQKYIDYISDVAQPQLPWETKAKYIEIFEKIAEEINFSIKNSKYGNYLSMDINILKHYVEELRDRRKKLQEHVDYMDAQNVDKIELCIRNLQKIFTFPNRPIMLEKLLTLGLRALNDAMEIKPNYPIGDDNEPTFTAPANMPDIVCFYKNFNFICEVTMLKNRDQWYNEGQPVMRHLRDFESQNSNKPSYCLFIAPLLHRDTINTFWGAIKYGYEGRQQKIIPLTIENFISIMNTLLILKHKNIHLKHTDLFRLYDGILNSSYSLDNSVEWLQDIPNIILLWHNRLISKIAA